MDKIRLGVIGAGGIVCRMHLPDLVKGNDFEVAVIGGRKEHRLKHQCEQFNIPRWSTITTKSLPMIRSTRFWLERHIHCMCLGASEHLRLESIF